MMDKQSPAAPTKPRPIKRWLLATEHSVYDEGAERVAWGVAQHVGPELRVVVPLVSNPEFEAVAPERAARVDADVLARIDDLRAQARDAGVVGAALDVTVRRGMTPAQEIVAEASEWPAEALIIRRRGKLGFLASLLVGEMVRNVVTQAPCDVVISPRTAQLWRQAVLVALDLSAPARVQRQVALRGASVAAAFGLATRWVTVVAAPDAKAGDTPLQGQAQTPSAARDALVALAQALHLAPTHVDVRQGRVVPELMASLTASGSDLIVLARHHGLPGERLPLGRVAHKVMGLSPCAVWVCAPSAEPTLA